MFFIGEIFNFDANHLSPRSFLTHVHITQQRPYLRENVAVATSAHLVVAPISGIDKKWQIYAILVIPHRLSLESC